MVSAEQKKKADWGILLPVFLLGVIGVVAIYSAAASESASMQKGLCLRQVIWLCAGLLLIFFSLLFDHKSIYTWAEGIYLISIGLLVAVLFFGIEAGGARRWLPMGPVAIQPSEFVKLAMVIMLAKYYSRKSSGGSLTWYQLIWPVVAVAVPFVLIWKQPDLGTAIVLLLIAASMTVFVGIARRTLYLLGGLAAILIPLFWSFFLHDYQRQRVLTFLDPDRDPLGAGYHIIQSKIAIGSGMITGKGFMQGTQSALAFLPEQRTDFIFSVVAEEWGLIGAVVVLLLYLLIVLWGISITYKSRDKFRVFLSVGITAMIFWPVFINVGMVTGILPVVGLPLPLLSYGGSSVITFMLGIALLLNISMKRSLIE